MRIERILEYNAIESTQKVARSIDRTQPTAVIARIQTGGRGRAGRRWFSPEGGLWITFMIPYEKKQRLAHYVTMLGSLAVLRAIEPLGVTGQLRWPNDVMINHRKVAGILGEYHRGAIICGIGINVNIYHFPSWVGSATSLALELDQKIEISGLREDLIRNFEYAFEQFEEGQGRVIVKLLRPYFTASGDLVTIDYGRSRIIGTVQDIDEEGALILRTETDKLIKVFSGEMRRVRWS
ncbi:biotin--[acetyl-CoA-carboxylase] ligase [candidate division WOR-3 bacterium]|uniref:biotin--[biotin carboxyl-carrier protein] ligase n=1 Tax=candidate division WOR-3 bacterium TaxID=2052148 RepID=A0A660SHU8_UNCW3|nr:MAG: biotin--[acetyl-CoA-carboxylase] ligase [candidate division WOR-3 bacterium]